MCCTPRRGGIINNTSVTVHYADGGIMVIVCVLAWACIRFFSMPLNLKLLLYALPGAANAALVFVWLSHPIIGLNKWTNLPQDTCFSTWHFDHKYNQIVNITSMKFENYWCYTAYIKSMHLWKLHRCGITIGVKNGKVWIIN